MDNLVAEVLDQARQELIEEDQRSLLDSGAKITYSYDDPDLQDQMYVRSIERALRNVGRMHGSITRVIIHLLFLAEEEKIYVTADEGYNSLEEWAYAKFGKEGVDLNYLSRFINAVEYMLKPIAESQVEVIALPREAGEEPRQERVDVKELINRVPIKAFKELPHKFNELNESGQQKVVEAMWNANLRSGAYKDIKRILNREYNAQSNADNPDVAEREKNSGPITFYVKEEEDKTVVRAELSALEMARLQGLLGDLITIVFEND